MAQIEQTCRILHQTPTTLRSLIAGLDDTLVMTNYGEDTFSPADVVSHLILGERIDWIPRIRIILEHGESRTFDPFPWDGIDPETRDATMTERLDVFERLRTRNLATLESLKITADDLSRTGMHPKLGPVTLGQMLTTWGVHDLHHTAQICKAVNYQFREPVGPWRPYVNTIPPDPVSNR